MKELFILMAVLLEPDCNGYSSLMKTTKIAVKEHKVKTLMKEISYKEGVTKYV